jgi:hypothetical protein
VIQEGPRSDLRPTNQEAAQQQQQQQQQRSAAAPAAARASEATVAPPQEQTSTTTTTTRTTTTTTTTTMTQQQPGPQEAMTQQPGQEAAVPTVEDVHAKSKTGDDLPNHLSFIPRKPEPLGAEFKAICSAITAIMVWTELQRGRESIRAAEFAKHGQLERIPGTEKCSSEVHGKRKRCSISS